MKAGLNLGGIKLPLDFCTKTAAILAQRRKGKTYTASVLAEEMVAAKQPFVALDPTGAWWGLRAGADGKSEGLPVVVLGGQHGDIPLERTGGRLVADLVVEEPGYYIVDFSLFESGQAERQFAVDFAERLYRAKGQPGRDFPLHLFVDEADRFVPQQIRKGSNETSAQLLGAFEAIVRRGGIRGLGTTLISQRAAVVNKNVLEMLDVLIVLRTIGPNDRNAIAGYIEAHGTAAERAAMMTSLASLDIGEAWVWEPGADPALFERVKIRARCTYNSSATPKAGERRVEPKRLAAVEIAKIEQRMAATIERAKADDPKHLRAQLSQAQATIRRLETQRPAVAPVPVPPPILGPDVLLRIEKAVDAGITLSNELQQAARGLQELGSTIWREGKGILESARLVSGRRPLVPTPPSNPVRGISAAPTRRIGQQSVRRVESALPKGERAVLIVVAQYPDGATKEQLTVMTGYKRSSRDAYLQRLREKGYIEQRGETVLPTEEGVEALGSDYEPLPTGDDLRRHWFERLPEGERRILEVLVEAYPEAVERSHLDQATGYKRSSRDAYLQRLGARKLVQANREGVRASEQLF